MNKMPTNKKASSKVNNEDNEKENIEDNTETIEKSDVLDAPGQLLEFDIATVDLQYPMLLQTFLGGRMPDIVKQSQSGNITELRLIYQWAIEQAILVEKLSNRARND